MMWKLMLAVAMAAGAAAADPVSDVMTAAEKAFDRMPVLAVVETIAGECGATDAVNREVAYCTTSNTIFVTQQTTAHPAAPYMVAHLLGHAVQVQHGIADIALREILRRRPEEDVLRGYVAGQVDCIAGFLYAKAGLPRASLVPWFEAEPFTGTHWGRNPLSVGPQVSVRIDVRDYWFGQGQQADSLAACAVGEFGANLLLDAYRG